MSENANRLDYDGCELHVGDTVYLPHWRCRHYLKYPAKGRVLGFETGDDGYSCVRVTGNAKITPFLGKWGETRETKDFLVHHDRVLLADGRVGPPFTSNEQIFRPGTRTTIDLPKRWVDTLESFASMDGLTVGDVISPFLVKLLEHAAIAGNIEKLSSAVDFGSHSDNLYRLRLDLPVKVAKKLILSVPVDCYDALLIGACVGTIKHRELS